MHYTNEDVLTEEGYVDNRKTERSFNNMNSAPRELGQEYRDVVKRGAFGFCFLTFLSLLVPSSGRLGYLITSLLLLAVAICLRLYQVRSRKKIPFDLIRDKIVKWYEGLERHQQLYVNVSLCIPLLGYAYFLDRRDVFIPVVSMFLLYCFGVAAYDVIRIYSKMSGTLLGKALIGIAFALGSNVAYSVSGWLVSTMTHVQSSTFPHTLAFLAIGTIPFLFIIVGAIYIPVAMFAIPIVMQLSQFMSHSPKLTEWIFGLKLQTGSRRYVAQTLIFQLVFYIFLATAASPTFFFVLNRCSKQIEWLISNSIFQFDMYPGTECKGRLDYRYASLGDENYILATKQSDRVVFEAPTKCALVSP